MIFIHVIQNTIMILWNGLSRALFFHKSFIGLVIVIDYNLLFISHSNHSCFTLESGSVPSSSCQPRCHYYLFSHTNVASGCKWIVQVNWSISDNDHVAKSHNRHSRASAVRLGVSRSIGTHQSCCFRWNTTTLSTLGFSRNLPSQCQHRFIIIIVIIIIIIIIITIIQAFSRRTCIGILGQYYRKQQQLYSCFYYCWPNSS